jgi:hypothetical protein
MRNLLPFSQLSSFQFRYQPIKNLYLNFFLLHSLSLLNNIYCIMSSKPSVICSPSSANELDISNSNIKTTMPLNDTSLAPHSNAITTLNGAYKKSSMALNGGGLKSTMALNGMKSRNALNSASGRRQSRAQIDRNAADSESKEMAAKVNRMQVTARLRKSGQKDWNSLKRDILASLNFRMTATFIKILQSKELDKLLLLAVEYGKWFVHVYLLQKQQEQSSSSRLRELPEHLVSIFLPAAITSISQDLENLTIESATSLEQARQKSKMILKEFGRAYCFLLLFAAQYRQESSKERLHFEQIYKMTIEVVSASVGLAYAPIVSTELNRLFRSSLFLNRGYTAPPKLLARPDAQQEPVIEVSDETKNQSKNSWV